MATESSGAYFIDSEYRVDCSSTSDSRWLEVVRALGEGYSHIFNVDCDSGIAQTYRAEDTWPEVDRMVAESFPFQERMRVLLDRFVLPEDRGKLAILTDLKALWEQLSGKGTLVIHYRSVVKRYVHFYSVRCTRIGDGADCQDLIVYKMFGRIVYTLKACRFSSI